MLKLLRRAHLLPILLCLALPGTGGLAIQAVHQCAVAAPWQAGADAGSSGSTADGHHAGHGTPASQDEPHPCTCVGHCTAASLATWPTPAVALSQVFEAPQHPVRIVLPHAPLPGRTPHLQPPANAPPLS